MKSIVHNGKVLDFRYKRVTALNFVAYDFYIGDIFLGQLFKDHNTWSAVAFGEVISVKMRMAHGFRTRYAASEYILKVKGYVTD
jgi:hypothetical protein